MVGLISVGDLRIVVQPKVPVPHLLHLFAKALQVPRLEDQPATAEAAAALWELVARWFLRSAMTVLRRDLARDYQVTQDTLQAVRGRVERVTAGQPFLGVVDYAPTDDALRTDRQNHPPQWLLPISRARLSFLGSASPPEDH